jgi:hypothetical protein
MLLDHKADVNAKSTNGMTALVMALANNTIESALVLLERGADVHIKDIYGRDALYYSLKHSDTTPTSFFLLCCGVDAKRVKIDEHVTQAKVDTAVAEYTYLHDVIATKQHVITKALSRDATVDKRVGLGDKGIYQEPLERVLEYLGLSVHPDQVVNSSIDGTLRQRVLIPNQPRNAQHWRTHIQKEEQWMKLKTHRDAYNEKMDAIFP